MDNMVDKQIKTINTLQLNLARKWRSKNFDEIIGQAIPVRMLKNSLYIGQFFPVYLFSGQRGCGKTSTARIFAAAVNCERLCFFQQTPKEIAIPCLLCTSCKAMLAGKHPDCIEIDAASHTGVDHVRQIIDSASLLPLLGSKKIYLIDEVHMLSKAAFNAFLKVLEEPPASVLFVLVTTDPEKIIETVKSRCFQIIFKPIDKSSLVTHLEYICNKENIAYEKDALMIIAQNSEGAARDALNVLEQVRFAHEKITKDAVFDVLGHLDDERLLQFFDALLNKPLSEFAQIYAQIITDTVLPTFLWKACIELFRAAICCTYNVPLAQFAHIKDRIQECSKEHNVEIFIGLMRMLYEHEMIFLKTSTPHAFLQMLLFQACQYVHGGFQTVPPQTNNLVSSVQQQAKNDTSKKKVVQSTKVDTSMHDPNHPDIATWSSFLHNVDTLNDPLIASVLKQGHLVHFCAKTGKLKAVFPRDFTMFEDVLMQSKSQWKPLLDTVFKMSVTLVVSYQDQESTKKKDNVSIKEVKKIEIKKTNKSELTRKKEITKVSMIDVSDKEIWKKTHIVLEVFPGTVTEVQEGENVRI